jgi:twitching motility protein PilT
MEDTRLGSILLESKVIREEDLQHCLEIQELIGASRPLGQILVEEGTISSQTLQELLDIQEARRRRQRVETPIEAKDPRRFLSEAMKLGASELHLSEGRPALVRVAGQLRSLSSQALEGPEVWQFVRDHMGFEVLEEIADRLSVTKVFQGEMGIRGRITAFRHFDGIGVSMRLHPIEVRTPQESGIDKAVLNTIQAGKGLILLTGEHGSGISETSASLLSQVVKDRGRYVLVLDEDHECAVPEGEAIVCMRKVGVHTKDYTSGLKAALREDPDVIFVGDASEPEAFDLTLHAAESGRLVVAVLHASSALDVLLRAIALYPKYEQKRVQALLATVMQCVLVVKLVPDSGGSEVHLATELLRFDENVREALRVGAFPQLDLLMRLEDIDNGHTMDSSLALLHERGVLSFQDLYENAGDKSNVLQSLRGPQGSRK